MVFSVVRNDGLRRMMVHGGSEDVSRLSMLTVGVSAKYTGTLAHASEIFSGSKTERSSVEGDIFCARFLLDRAV